MMNIFENPVLARGLAIAAGGVVVGLLLSFGRGIVRLVWKYKQEAATVPVEEILPAMALAVTPITKAFYATRARVSSAIPGGSALSGWPVERASAGG